MTCSDPDKKPPLASYIVRKMSIRNRQSEEPQRARAVIIVAMFIMFYFSSDNVNPDPRLSFVGPTCPRADIANIKHSRINKNHEQNINFVIELPPKWSIINVQQY